MNPTAATTPRAGAFELRLQSLFHEGRALAFPCDSAGRVDLARLSERGRSNLLRAVALIGREFAMPALRPRAPQ